VAFLGFDDLSGLGIYFMDRDGMLHKIVDTNDQITIGPARFGIRLLRFGSEGFIETASGVSAVFLADLVGGSWHLLRADITVVPDSDGDGVPDDQDDFPFNPNETTDSDGDGMGDNFENQFGLNRNDPSDAALDNDGDGVSNLDEFRNQSNPLVNEGAVITIINTILLDD
jgi:hypothetical protein